MSQSLDPDSLPSKRVTVRLTPSMHGWLVKTGRMSTISDVIRQALEDYKERRKAE